MSVECQKIVERYDELLFKSKALAAIIWSAASGWAMTSGKINLFLVALFSVGCLWFLAGTLRGAQKRYIRRSEVLYQFLMNAGELAEIQQSGTIPDHVPRSLRVYEEPLERFGFWLRGVVSPTVSVFFGSFFLISAFLYFSVR